MRDHISSENTSFSFLKKSGEFMEQVLNNITSCVLLLDKKMEIQAFNDPFKTIFSNKPDEDKLYKRCGNAIGCAHVVEEMKDCGETTHCCNCEIRKSAIEAYSTKKPVYKNVISREFFNSKGKKEMKHLQFSARHFSYDDGNYIILIVSDITRLTEQQNLIDEQSLKLAEYYLKN